MTTLCLGDWVESAEDRAWRAASSPSPTLRHASPDAPLFSDQFAKNTGNCGTVRFVVPSNPIIEEYVS
jgi:hypothetical protein